MAEKLELEQTHCVVSKVFAFTVPPLGSAEGFKASLWPKQPIWVGRLRVVSRAGKCAILLEHTDKDGLFASCPIQNEHTVEPTVDSSRYFVLRLSDGKGRQAFIGIGFNDRAQAFDFKVSLQDWENANREGAVPLETGPKADYSIPQGGSIHVNFGSSGSKKERKKSVPDVSAALAGMNLDAPKEDKEKKKKKKKEKEAAAAAAASSEGQPSFAPSAAAASIIGASSSSAAQPSLIDFGFGDFDPLATPKKQPDVSTAPRRASIADPFAAAAAPVANDPFAASAAPSFGATPFDTPFDDTPSDWVKF